MAKSLASRWAVQGEPFVTNALDKASPVPREAEEMTSKLDLRVGCSRITVPGSTALLWGHKLMQHCSIHL